MRRRTLIALCALLVTLTGSVIGWLGSRPSAPQAAAAIVPVGPNTDTINGVSAAQLAAFTAASAGATVTTEQLMVGSLRRQYLVIAPATSAGPIPVIVVLAGSDASVVTEAERDQLVPLAQSGKAILVYPSSATTDLTWNVGAAGCCQQAGAEQVPDAAFITQLTGLLKSRYSSDVDLVGFSNGGKLAYTLTCTSPSQFNAVAVVAAVPLTQCGGDPLPMLIAIGSDDDREPLVTAVSKLSATAQLQNAAAAWRQRDGCASTSTTAVATNATITTWASCAAHSQVVQVLYSGIAHVWPRSNDIGGAPSAAATLIWAFLAAN